MTDVYISYARQDRDRVRLLAEMLQFEGWDVWMDPSDSTVDGSAAVDLKLGSAGAILVVWSPNSRASEYVRSEAATGLYKNKLIQARLDVSAPPRPFDQVEVIDIGLWSGERDDPNWRRIMGAVRLYAGAPGSARPQVTRRAVSGPAYLEPSRSVAWGPLIAAGVLILGGGIVWFADPFGWRSSRTAVAGELDTVTTSAAATPADATLEAAASAVFEDTEESRSAWDKVNRKEPDGLRRYISGFPRSSGAETARSLLRVLDAQAWVNAVTSDNESAYQLYLKDFPVDAAMAGAMATAARERLLSLAAERSQAIEEIQRGLTALKLYKGVIDGKGGDGTAGAIRQFASNIKRSYPTLSTAAPRDLRAFADTIARAVADSGRALPPSLEPAAPITAAATTPAPSSTAAAAEADRQRIAQAQAAAQAAAATQAPKVAADQLAQNELQRIAEGNAWSEAEKAGTVSGYQTYLAAYPSGSRVAAARSAITRLSRPPAFSLEQVPTELRAAADAARKAQQTANARASAARETAVSAEKAPNARAIVAADGDKYETQIASGAPNGLGVRISGDARNAGDKYRGELRNGQSAGLGVYEYGENPNNAGTGALRYEGEHVSDRTSGYGVIYWKNGDNFAGQETSPTAVARGVLTFSNGQRYEGEMRNGARNGLGVVWAADGTVLMAGRWQNGELVEPMAAPSPAQAGGGGE